MKHFARHVVLVAVLALLPLSLLLLAGCQSSQSTTAQSNSSAFSNVEASPAGSSAASTPSAPLSPSTNSDSFVLREGDTVRITFPGAASLDRLVIIRRDGRVTLPEMGEFMAAGLTPSQMQKQLLDFYGPQLQTKEVSVSVESSAFPVYVTGAVQRPGKVLADRPLTVLEAIMEAGGPDYTKANLKAVRILRTQQGRTLHYVVNVRQVLRGQGSELFQLKPSDIVYVPERFSIF